MGFGDELMAAGHAQTVWGANPSLRVAICDRAGDVRWHEVWDGNPIIAKPRDVANGERVQRIKNGVGCRPYIKSLTVERGLVCTDWKAAEHIGRLYLTEDELAVGRALKAQFGSYVVIEPCQKSLSNPNKLWGWHRYEAVIKACPDVRFVQVMHAQSVALPGVETVRAERFREACGVLASASGFLGSEGGMHHACAALGIRAVVIFGGFISPDVTGYPTHINLADTRDGSPCGRWRPCQHCHRAMARISPRKVVASLRQLVSARDEVAA